MENLRSRGRQARDVILEAEPARRPPASDRRPPTRGCRKAALSPLDVAVRSSATAEDLPDASFAGQQETYLNVQGSQVLLETCKRCFASLFTDRAISYRVDKGFDHFKVGLSIGVQRMVRSDLAASGVMFSIDTETGFRDAVLINAVVRPGRERRPGVGQSRRILRLQADAEAGLPADPPEDARHQGIQAGLRRRRQQDDQERPGAARGPRPLRHQRRRDPGAGPLGLP